MGKVIFVRHGETEWNRQGKFRGRVDMPLNETGTEQAWRVAERLASIPVNAIFAGPSMRTMETAKFTGERVSHTRSRMSACSV